MAGKVLKERKISALLLGHVVDVREVAVETGVVAMQKKHQSESQRDGEEYRRCSVVPSEVLRKIAAIYKRKQIILINNNF